MLLAVRVFLLNLVLAGSRESDYFVVVLIRHIKFIVVLDLQHFDILDEQFALGAIWDLSLIHI